MTQKDKQLLRCICDGLPYDIKCKVIVKESERFYDANIVGVSTLFQEAYVLIKQDDAIDLLMPPCIPMKSVKPYLRLMSSMTDEEENEYKAINCYEGLFPRNEDAIDYVLSHHLDYRGLIEKGLALEAPDGMYK